VIPNGSGPGPGDQGDAPGGAGQELPGLRACIEAILLVVDEPVPDLLLAQVLEPLARPVAPAPATGSARP